MLSYAEVSIPLPCLHYLSNPNYILSVELSVELIYNSCSYMVLTLPMTAHISPEAFCSVYRGKVQAMDTSE